MALSYEAAAAANGEMRLYIETTQHMDVAAVKAELGYRYAYERPHRAAHEPWDYAMGDTRPVMSELEFGRERERAIEVLARTLPGGWTAEMLYYPPGRGFPEYHWSSEEGTLLGKDHPPQVINDPE